MKVYRNEFGYYLVDENDMFLSYIEPEFIIYFLSKTNPY